MEHKTPLRLKRHYAIVAHSADIVEMRYGVWNPVSFTLTDENGSGHLLRILHRLDGKMTPEAIAAAEQVPLAEVEALINHLDELELVETGPSHAIDHYIDNIIPNLLPYGRPDTARRPRVVLLGDQPITDLVAQALGGDGSDDRPLVLRADKERRKLLAVCGAAGLHDALTFEEAARPFADWRDSLVVFASATINPVELRGFNRVSLRHRIPWLHAAIDGPFLLIGPTFVPFSSPCYECMEARVLMNLREASSYQRYKQALLEGRVAGALAPLDGILSHMLASMTAYEALNFLLTGASFTSGKFLSVYLPTMEFIFNELLRLPGCPACGSSPERDDRELVFDLRQLIGDDPTDTPKVPR